MAARVGKRREHCDSTLIVELSQVHHSVYPTFPSSRHPPSHVTTGKDQPLALAIALSSHPRPSLALIMTHTSRMVSPSQAQTGHSFTSSQRTTSSQSSRSRFSLALTQLSLCVLALLSLLPTAQAQTQNVTQLTGTWVSGSGQVMTGLQFFNPISKNFTVPLSGGIAYSFTEDLPNGGHFETSTFTYTSNRE